MYNVLNILSIIATFAVAQILLYVFFNVLFHRIAILDKPIIAKIQVKHILYVTITTILLLKYTEFYLPHKN